VLYGSTGPGLSASGDEFWHQDVSGVLDGCEITDHFGAALAAGDFSADGRADLAVGVPGEYLGDLVNAGAVNVLYGSTGPGLSASGDEFWHQDVSGVPGAAEGFDAFGSALAAGNFDGDVAADLAVGAPGEAIGSLSDAGAVSVLYGAPLGGLSASGSQLWHQDVSGVLDASEARDAFGAALAAGDFDGDGYADLAAGVPEEAVGSVEDAGAANVLYGVASTGLSATGDELWYQGATARLAGDAREDELGVVEAPAPPASVTEAPAAPALLPAAPNPFRDATTFRFTLPAAGPVCLTVYDALGRAVAVLVDEAREAGMHAVAFDASTLPAGVYVARLVVAGQALTQRVTVLQ
jgi:hypothetical protein